MTIQHRKMEKNIWESKQLGRFTSSMLANYSYGPVCLFLDPSTAKMT